MENQLNTNKLEDAFSDFIKQLKEKGITKYTLSLHDIGWGLTIQQYEKEFTQSKRQRLTEVSQK